MASLDSFSRQKQREILAEIIKEKRTELSASENLKILTEKLKNMEKEKPKKPSWEFSRDKALEIIVTACLFAFYAAIGIVAVVIFFRILCLFPGRLIGEQFQTLMFNISKWFLTILLNAVGGLLKLIFGSLLHGSLKSIILTIIVVGVVFALITVMHWCIYSNIYGKLLSNYNRKYKYTLDDLNKKINNSNNEINSASKNFTLACNNYNIPNKYRSGYALSSIKSNMETWNLSFYEACRKYDENEYREDAKTQRQAAAEWAKMQAETRRLVDDEYRKKVIGQLDDIKQQQLVDEQQRKQQLEYERWRRNL